MINRLTGSLDFNAQALTLRAERQRLNFAQALRQATGMAGAGAAVVPTASHAAHLGAGPVARAEAHLVYATPSQTNLDRNTVDMDRERANFADNAIRYEATLRFINGSARTVLSAITGQ
jgi:flagellar basal-body rod protein FlgB